jgi:hypothetical protein
MAKLNKALVLYDRDEEGELIPQTRKLELTNIDKENYPEYTDMEISIIPLTRGKLKKIFGLGGKDNDTKPDTDRDEDAEIIVQYCKDPQFTLDELKYAKPVVVRSIVRTIFLESGVKFDDNSGTKRIEDDEFGKN